MYNLITYSDNYSKTSANWWQYYRDEPALTDAITINSFATPSYNSALFKFKQKIIGKTASSCLKNVEVMVPLSNI